MSLVMSAALAGGSLLQSCEVRVRDAVVLGTRGYISTLLDPTNVLQTLFAQPDESTSGLLGP